MPTWNTIHVLVTSPASPWYHYTWDIQLTIASQQDYREKSAHCSYQRRDSPPSSLYYIFIAVGWTGSMKTECWKKWNHVNQTNKFTTIAAKAAFQRGIQSNHFKIFTRPPLKFLRDYFWKRGILDGRYGFIICLINSLSALLKYSKLKDLQDGKRID